MCYRGYATGRSVTSQQESVVEERMCVRPQMLCYDVGKSHPSMEAPRAKCLLLQRPSAKVPYHSVRKGQTPSPSRGVAQRRARGPGAHVLPRLCHGTIGNSPAEVWILVAVRNGRTGPTSQFICAWCAAGPMVGSNRPCVTWPHRAVLVRQRRCCGKIAGVA